MANILLTDRCVRKCPYCFAKETIEKGKTEYLKFEDLIYLADLHKISNEHISLLGGEPTLHPDFTSFVLYLVSRDIFVNVFTSGIMSRGKLEDLKYNLSDIPNNKLSFVVNLNHPSLNTTHHNAMLSEFFKVFSHLTSISYNIYQKDFNLDFVFDTILRYGLKRNIRFGLAQPIPGEKNICIGRDDLKTMAAKFMSYKNYFERLKIEIGFDCGMPMCLFSDEEIGVLYKLSKNRLSFSCGPAIDIGTDLKVWSCFPLSQYNSRSVYDFEDLYKIRKYYEEMHNMVRAEESGLFYKCDQCSYYKKGVCSGGCLAHIFDDFTNEPKIRNNEVYINN